MWNDVLLVLNTYIQELWLVTCKMAPWVLAGFLVAGILSIYFSPEFVCRHLGSGRWGTIFRAALIGVPMPVCSTGVIPATLKLRRHGAGKGAIASFLIATPQTGVDSIIVIWSMLGWVFALFKALTAFIGGVIGGVAVEGFLSGDTEGREIIDDVVEKEPEKAILQVIKYGFGVLFKDVAKPLLIGLLIAATISTFIPPSFFDQFKYNGVGLILLMLVIGIPIYVSPTAAVPIATALILKGISPGAALVFLIAGPAINLATLTTMFKIIGRRGVAIYLSAIAITAVGAGFLLNMCYAYAPEIISSTIKSGPDVSIFHQVCGVLLLVLIFRIVISGEGRAEESPEDFILDDEEGDIGPDIANRLTFTVPEMTGEKCAETIREVILNLQDVECVEFDLAKQLVTVTFNYATPDMVAVRAVLSAAGFSMKF